MQLGVVTTALQPYGLWFLFKVEPGTQSFAQNAELIESLIDEARALWMQPAFERADRTSHW